MFGWGSGCGYVWVRIRCGYVWVRIRLWVCVGDDQGVGMCG